MKQTRSSSPVRFDREPPPKKKSLTAIVSENDWVTDDDGNHRSPGALIFEKVFSATRRSPLTLVRATVKVGP